jgi:regulatory protein YycI of two-component signal transduction system YycFG
MKVLIIISIFIGYKFIHKKQLKSQNESSNKYSHSNDDDDDDDVNMKNSLKNRNNSHLFRLKVIRHVSIDFRNFKLEDCIGQGNYGTVYKCSLPPSFEKKYAVKHIECVDVCFIIVF